MNIKSNSNNFLSLLVPSHKPCHLYWDGINICKKAVMNLLEKPKQNYFKEKNVTFLKH